MKQSCLHTAITHALTGGPRCRPLIIMVSVCPIGRSGRGGPSAFPRKAFIVFFIIIILRFWPLFHLLTCMHTTTTFRSLRSAVWSKALLCTESGYCCTSLLLHAIICPPQFLHTATKSSVLRPNFEITRFGHRHEQKALVEGGQGGGWRNSPHARVHRGGSACLEGQCAFAWQDRQVLLKTMRIN